MSLPHEVINVTPSNDMKRNSNVKIKQEINHMKEEVQKLESELNDNKDD